MSTITETAQVIEEGVKTFARVEPTIATVAGMFIPGAAPIVAMVQPWAPVALNFVERALDDIAKANGGDMMAALIELFQHISKGGPNSPVLTEPEAVSTGA